MTGGGKRLPVLSDRAEVPSPAFQRIAIVGLGAVGGSLALALRHAWPDALVIGVDTHAAVEAAIRMHAIDVGSDDLIVAADAELLVLAGSADENARVLPYLADAIAGEAVVLALCGEPAAAEWARMLPGRLSLVVGLPAVELRGSGIRAASADLFRGRPWTLTAAGAVGEAVNRLYDLVRAIGAVPSAEAKPAQGLAARGRTSA